MPSSIEMSLDGNKPTRQITLADKRTEVANFVEQLYKPNFILRQSYNSKIISASSSVSATTFGDILPFYPSQGQLIDFIVLTKESLISFLLNSRALFVCTFSLFSQLVNSLAYQTYLISIAGYDQISTLPDKYTWLKQEFVGLIDTFSSVQNRELWWLGLQLESRVYTDKLVTSLNQSLIILRKFYLTAFVLVCLTTLFVVGQSDGVNNNPKQTTQSTLSKFIGDQSLVIAQINTDDMSELNISKLSSESLTIGNAQKEEDVNMIIEHQVAEGETLIKIATFYGLKTETLKFNNNLKDDEEVKVGDKILLPWSDGYIYRAEDTVSADYLANLYGIKAEDIITRNNKIYNTEKNHFDKGSLVLITTDDFEKIANANKQEEDRKENLRKAEEERKRMLAYSSSSGDTYRGVTSDQARSEGFIWPTSGIITRCVQPGHVACDIANATEPPIFAAKDGVVSAVYKYTVIGYGLAVVIDHGNGLKTLYAHMSEIYVEQGEFVKQGISIGKMGCTGGPQYCTGTHLHFEVIQDGVKQNPLIYLP